MPRRKKQTPGSMSGFMLEMFLLQSYGPRLTVQQLIDVLQVGRTTLYRDLAAGTFPIKTYVVNGTRYADYRDVAQHLDKCRLEAQEAAQ